MEVTIWIDALLFDPFYAVAAFAFVRGFDWIRVPALLWTAMMLTNVSVILGEEAFGEHRTPHLAIVLPANASWVLFPLLLLCRMCHDRPFSQRAP